MSKYETPDVGMASYLKANGCEYIESRVEGKKVYFIFNDEKTCKEKEKDFPNSPERKFYTELRIFRMIIKDESGGWR